MLTCRTLRGAGPSLLLKYIVITLFITVIFSFKTFENLRRVNY
uniref:Uncharacterized protein n=1 Tax=Anguilla anguilla TaxID=7936 RepID=A0A0E9U3A3_ANGAN